MNKQEFITHLEEALEVNPGSIREDQVLADLNEWDSIAVIAFIAMVDTQFGISLNPQKIGEAKTVHDLIALLGNAVDAC